MFCVQVRDLPEEQQQLLRNEGDQWKAQPSTPHLTPSPLTPPKRTPYTGHKTLDKRKPVKPQAKGLAETSQSKNEVRYRVDLETSPVRRDRKRRQTSPSTGKELPLLPAYTSVPDLALDLNTSANIAGIQNPEADRNIEAENVMKQLQFHQLFKFNSSVIGASNSTGIDLSCPNQVLNQPHRIISTQSNVLGTGGNGDDSAVNMVANQPVSNQPVQVRIQSGSQHTISLQLPEYLTIPLHKAATSSLNELQAATNAMNNTHGVPGLDPSIWSQHVFQNQPQ